MENKEDFYLRYVTPNRPDRVPQRQIFSVGSAFDAYAKNFIHEALFGKSPEFEFTTLFEKQVEPHNRDWALKAGKICFDAYRNSGALIDLLMILRDADGDAQFEFTVSTDEAVTQMGEVRLLGKPDAYFKHKFGEYIVLDWKVNGYMSKATPKPGYVMIRDGIGVSRNTNRSHKDAVVVNRGGLLVNLHHTMDSVDADWARQLAIYGWLCGQTVGSMFVVAIDQLACEGPGKIRVAEHRSYVSPEFQMATYNLAQRIWTDAHDGHFFKEMTIEESVKRCKVLDTKAAQMNDPALRMLLN
jgi:hypothetical protein